eukprot:gb/GECG01006432.1/.p1 GENE.gb/GECG01006432.1/~~gb/GECG01006432.1/.p1  ORF type:complete len:303 (+),score=39.86 gb/GECG01006432.1/:1-909(+)
MVKGQSFLSFNDFKKKSDNFQKLSVSLSCLYSYPSAHHGSRHSSSYTLSIADTMNGDNEFENLPPEKAEALRRRLFGHDRVSSMGSNTGAAAAQGTHGGWHYATGTSDHHHSEENVSKTLSWPHDDEAHAHNGTADSAVQKRNRNPVSPDREQESEGEGTQRRKKRKPVPKRFGYSSSSSKGEASGDAEGANSQKQRSSRSGAPTDVSPPSTTGRTSEDSRRNTSTEKNAALQGGAKPIHSYFSPGQEDVGSSTTTSHTQSISHSQRQDSRKKRYRLEECKRKANYCISTKGRPFNSARFRR